MTTRGARSALYFRLPASQHALIARGHYGQQVKIVDGLSAFREAMLAKLCLELPQDLLFRDFPTPACRLLCNERDKQLLGVGVGSGLPQGREGFGDRQVKCLLEL